MVVPSPEFWYQDGNVVIKVENYYFKLFKSRLEQHCLRLKAIFREQGPKRLYMAPPELSADDFTAFMRYLDLPA